MLEIRDLTGGYQDTLVLRDVDLTVPEGSVVALLGPNGAGKTTLLRMASGLLRPAKGSVWMDGAEVTRLRPSKRAKRGICHLPEGRGIFPSLTVRENLVMQAKPGEESVAVDLAAARFPVLGRRLKQQAGTLSGGEQQMLAMLRAYLADAKVVLVDEASLGLAPIVVDEIFTFLHGLAASGVSLLLVEQYVSRALELADHVYMLNHGQIVFDGSPDDLQTDAVFESYMGGEIEAATR